MVRSGLCRRGAGEGVTHDGQVLGVGGAREGAAERAPQWELGEAGGGAAPGTCHKVDWGHVLGSHVV